MTDTGPDRVRGVVLAGGRSTRFGDDDKALATLEGRPLVDRVVEAVGDATDGSPLLSVATDVQAERLRDALDDRAVEVVRDSAALSGPLAGFDAAADAAEAPWLFVCACDMPLVTPESIAALRSHAPAPASSDDSGAVDAVVPVADGYDQPLHALYRRTALDRALATLSEGEAVGALLDALAVERVAAADSEASLAAAATNVNTRADLDALRRD